MLDVDGFPSNCCSFYVYMCGTVTCSDRCRLTIPTGDRTGRLYIIPRRKPTHNTHGSGAHAPFHNLVITVACHGHRSSTSNVLFSAIVCQGIHICTCNYMVSMVYWEPQSMGVTGPGQSMDVCLHFLNISHQLRFKDISWGHLAGTSRGDTSWGHLVGTSRGRLDVGVARRSHGVVLQLHRRSRWVAVALVGCVYQAGCGIELVSIWWCVV